MNYIHKKHNNWLFFNDYQNEAKLFFHRFLIIIFIMFFLMIILIINLFYIQIINHKRYETRSYENRIKLIPIPPTRGIIYDRNGIPLAINRTFYQLELINNNYKYDLNKILLELHDIFNFSDEDIKKIKKKYYHSKYMNSLILKNNLSEVEISRFAVNQHRFNNIEIKMYQQRYYPYGPILTHVIGYVSKINKKDIDSLKNKGLYNNYISTINIGKIGIERYYENILHGKSGYREVEVNSHGKIIRELYRQLPESGKDIYLTIDLDLQMKINKLLSINKAAVIVTNPSNGEILALISSPTYDPNLFVNGISKKDYNILLNNPDYPLVNRTTQGLYSPASTVKPFMAIAALNENVIDINSTIFDSGWWQLPNHKKKYRDWKKNGHGKINVLNAIIESADTFFYKISYDMGIDCIAKWMYKFGYGRYTGIDLFEENQGLMPTREWKEKQYKIPWYKGDTIPVGIGQGYWITTPIQMAKALMILINNGNIKIPHLLYSIDNNKILLPYEHNSVVSIKNNNLTYWNLVKLGMYGAANFSNGTISKNFFNAPYKAAIKSGTAQLFSYKTYDPNKLNERLRDHKLIIGYAPYHNPIASVTIILENGGSSISIGNLTRNIFDYILLRHNYNKNIN